MSPEHEIELPGHRRPPVRRAQAFRLALLITAAPLALACSPDSGPYFIDDVREIEVDSRTATQRATSAQRFGFATGRPTEPGATQGPALSWTLPEGWRELSASQMRRANFALTGRDDVECYLTVLPGAAGGVAANVDRWRGQMGLESMSQTELADLPRRELFGKRAVLVDLEGSYQGMGQTPIPDTRLVGLILEAARSTVFLKMVGPAAVVAQELDHFEELAASFELGGASSGTEQAESAQGIRWSAPEGWLRAPHRTMRLVTYVSENGQGSECYVTILGGDAGGVAANVNRWRGQIGLDPLSAEGIAELPRRSVLGETGYLVELEGDFVGMSGTGVEDALFLGLICELEGGMLFVKMTGPADRIRSERTNFLSFCDSLEREVR